MINKLRERFSRPRSGFENTGEFPQQAAVLIPVTDHQHHPDVVLTKRAEHLSTHSGEVSFPGGKWEAGDNSLIETALRESQEEIDLPPQMVEIISQQPHHISLWGIKVTPYVGIIPHDVELKPDKTELDAIFRVPLSFLIEDNRTRTEIYHRHDREWWSPVYHFEGFKIWGLTARILVDFLNAAWDADIGREHVSAPELRR
jgi:8-oxo-dGTP pyrophosphatase MutT (NUDIX family)